MTSTKARYAGPGKSADMRTWPRRPFRSAALIALALGAGAPKVRAQDLFSGAATVEGRAYPSGGLYPRQHDAFGSVTLEPELFWSTSDGQHAFTLAPFVRLDGGDSERTHVDLREAYWRTYGETWELEAGLVRTFWGVTESQHLVDSPIKEEIISRQGFQILLVQVYDAAPEVLQKRVYVSPRTLPAPLIELFPPLLEIPEKLPALHAPRVQASGEESLDSL